MAAIGRINGEEEASFRELEERLSTPATGESRESLNWLLSPDFQEFGSSGRVFARDTVLDALAPGVQPGVVIEHFRANAVAAGVVLVTYLSRHVTGPTWKPPALRSSLWCWREERWQLVFHQGTRLPQEER